MDRLSKSNELRKQMGSYGSIQDLTSGWNFGEKFFVVGRNQWHGGFLWSDRSDWSSTFVGNLMIPMCLEKSELPSLKLASLPPEN